MENIPSEKDAFGHCQEPSGPKATRTFPHPHCVQNNLLLPLLCFPSCKPKASQVVPSGPQHPHPHTLTQPTPCTPWQCSCSKTEGTQVAYPLTPGQVVCSDLRRLVSLSQGARCGGLTGWTLLPWRTNSSSLGQQGASRMLGRWVREHRERSGVQ